MTEAVAKLKEWVDGSQNIVFFGGAGVSTESGIRISVRWTACITRNMPGHPKPSFPIPSLPVKHPNFNRFYRDKMLCLDAKPNAAHLKLAETGKGGKTAGRHHSKHRWPAPGCGFAGSAGTSWSVHRNFCMRCHRSFPPEEILNSTGVPTCPCGGTIKPDVVLYEESLDNHTLRKKRRIHRSCRYAHHWRHIACRLSGCWADRLLHGQQISAHQQRCDPGRPSGRSGHP